MIPELRYKRLRSIEETKREMWQHWICKQDASDGFGYSVKYKFFCEPERRPKEEECTFHSLEDLKHWWDNSWKDVEVVEMRQKYSLLNNKMSGCEPTG